MPNQHNPPVQKTFLQDRFDILIKRQKAGMATFNELTELDEIVNRDPTIREMVLEEMQSTDEPENSDDLNQEVLVQTVKRSSFMNRLADLISRGFHFKTIGTVFSAV